MIFILLFLGIIQLVLFIFHLFEYQTIVAIFQISQPVTLAIVQSIFAILSISFVASSVVEGYYNNIYSRTFYRFSAIWLGFMVYLLIADVLFYISLTVLVPAGASLMTITSVGKGLLALAVLVTGYGLWNAKQLNITSIDVQLSKLPASWKGKRAVWISDLQLGQIYTKKYSQRVTDKIKEINPDILFVGGDLYDGVHIDADDAIKPFSELHPPLGKYFITGNHEEFTDISKRSYVAAVQKAGIRPLIDEAMDIDGLTLVGVDYMTTKKKADFIRILDGLTKDKSKCYILLKHTPSNLNIAEQEGVSLMISGHTHRAQMMPLNMFTMLIYKKYDHGLNKFGNMFQYTSCGTGTWGPPIRIGSRSEIVLMKFV